MWSKSPNHPTCSPDVYLPITPPLSSVLRIFCGPPMWLPQISPPPKSELLMENLRRLQLWTWNLPSRFIISATESGMCGYIERDEKLASYCFCYGDYCNTASVINHTVSKTTLCLILSSLVTLRAVLDSWFDIHYENHQLSVLEIVKIITETKNWTRM